MIFKSKKILKLEIIKNIRKIAVRQANKKLSKSLILKNQFLNLIALNHYKNRKTKKTKSNQKNLIINVFQICSIIKKNLKNFKVLKHLCKKKLKSQGP